MHASLKKLVNAGKIPAEFAARLDKFSPDKYVLHQEFGVGKVIAWSLAQQEIQISFENRKALLAKSDAADARKAAEKLGLKLAFNTLTPIPEGHFLIACYDDPKGCYEKANDKKQILDFLRMVIQDNKSLREGIDEVLPMQPEDLERFLSDRVIPAKEWKSWWGMACAAMRNAPGFRLPTKRGEAIMTREASSAAEALLADYKDANTLESSVRILDQAYLGVLKGEFSIVAELAKSIEEDISKDRTEPQHVLELIIIRDEILADVAANDADKAKLDEALAAAGGTNMTSLPRKLRSIPSGDLVLYIGELSDRRQHEVFEILPAALGDAWQSYATNIFIYGGAKVIDLAANFILTKGDKEQFFADIANGISRQNLSLDALIWVREKSNGMAEELGDITLMSLKVALTRAIEGNCLSHAKHSECIYRLTDYKVAISGCDSRTQYYYLLGVIRAVQALGWNAESGPLPAGHSHEEVTAWLNSPEARDLEDRPNLNTTYRTAWRNYLRMLRDHAMWRRKNTWGDFNGIDLTGL